MKIDKLLKLVKTLKPTAFDDEILLMWVNEIEGMVLNEIHLVAVADLTPYELGENGEVPTAELTAPYPYDKLYTQYLMAQIDYANGEYSKYQNTMEMFNACYTAYVHYVAEVLAPADGRATLLQYYLSAYAIAQKHGYTGTEEQWIASLHGEAGKSVEMRYQDKIVQWMREGAAAWESLIDMQDIQDAITQDAQDTIQATATSAAATATQAAQAAKTAAEAAKKSAEESAGDALQSAQDASQYNDAAETAATTATGAKTAAQSAAQTAQTAAGTAEDAAEDAAQAKTDAETAKTAAQTAKQNAETAAQTAQTQKAAAQEAASDAEAWSQGTRSGTAVGTADETYHNNAKYWAQQAAASGGGGGGTITAAAVIGALGYTPADENDIPTALPNPSTLTVTVDGQETTYDGSTEKTLTLGALAKKSEVALASDVAGTLPLAKGGTGATTAAAARTALGLGALSTKGSVTLSGSDVTGTLPLAKGGTGATTAAAARTALGLGSLATKSSVALSGADVTGTLPISKGGTGATTVAAALAALGGLPKTGGTMVNSGDEKGCITFPGNSTAYRTGRDEAAVKVQYPSGGSVDHYVPIFSGKGKTCSWDAAVYGDKVNLAQIGDEEYAAGTNAPKKLYVIDAEGVTGMQGWNLVASGSLTENATLSGSADNSKYKTVHILLGTLASGSNYYQSYDFPFPADGDYWNIYIPAQNDYFRAKVETTAAGGITVTMLSDATRMCYIYASL